MPRRKTTQKRPRPVTDRDDDTTTISTSGTSGNNAAGKSLVDEIMHLRVNHEAGTNIGQLKSRDALVIFKGMAYDDYVAEPPPKRHQHSHAGQKATGSAVPPLPPLPPLPAPANPPSQQQPSQQQDVNSDRQDDSKRNAELFGCSPEDELVATNHSPRPVPPLAAPARAANTDATTTNIHPGLNATQVEGVVIYTGDLVTEACTRLTEAHGQERKVTKLMALHKRLESSRKGQAQTKDLQTQVDDLTRKLNFAVKARQKAQSQLADLTVRLADKDKATASAKQAAEKQNRAAESAALQRARKNIADLATDNTKLKNALTEARDAEKVEVEELRGKVTELSRKAMALQLQLTAAEKQIEKDAQTISRQQQAPERQATKLSTEIASLETRCQQLTSQLAEAGSLVRVHTDRIKSMETTFNTKHEFEAEQAKKLQLAETEIHQLRKDTQEIQRNWGQCENELDASRNTARAAAAENAQLKIDLQAAIARATRLQTEIDSRPVPELDLHMSVSQSPAAARSQESASQSQSQSSSSSSSSSQASLPPSPLVVSVALRASASPVRANVAPPAAIQRPDVSEPMSPVLMSLQPGNKAELSQASSPNRVQCAQPAKQPGPIDDDGTINDRVLDDGHLFDEISTEDERKRATQQIRADLPIESSQPEEQTQQTQQTQFSQPRD